MLLTLLACAIRGGGVLLDRGALKDVEVKYILPGFKPSCRHIIFIVPKTGWDQNAVHK